MREFCDVYQLIPACYFITALAGCSCQAKMTLWPLVNVPVLQMGSLPQNVLNYGLRLMFFSMQIYSFLA